MLDVLDCLAILGGELDSDTEALPVHGGLLSDVFSALLLGRHQRTDLGSKGTGSADLASSDSDEDLDELGGVKIWRHGFRQRAWLWGFRVLKA